MHKKVSVQLYYIHTLKNTLKIFKVHLASSKHTLKKNIWISNTIFLLKILHTKNQILHWKIGKFNTLFWKCIDINLSKILVTLNFFFLVSVLPHRNPINKQEPWPRIINFKLFTLAYKCILNSTNMNQFKIDIICISRGPLAYPKHALSLPTRCPAVFLNFLIEMINAFSLLILPLEPSPNTRTSDLKYHNFRIAFTFLLQIRSLL